MKLVYGWYIDQLCQDCWHWMDIKHIFLWIWLCVWLFVYTRAVFYQNSRALGFSKRVVPMAGSAGDANKSRTWSCSTLSDGLEYLVKQAQHCEEQESKMEKLIQDSLPNSLLVIINHLNECIYIYTANILDMPFNIYIYIYIYSPTAFHAGLWKETTLADPSNISCLTYSSCLINQIANLTYNVIHL